MKKNEETSFEDDERKLPDGWRWVKLGDVCDVTKLAGFEYTKYVKYVSNGEYIALRAQNVRNVGLDLENVVYITKEVASYLSRSKLSVGDVVMTFIGANIGEATWIDKNDTYYCAPNIAKITPNLQLLNSQFLTRLIHSQIIRKQIETINESTAQQSLSMRDIRNFLIPITELKEQKRITVILNEKMEGVEKVRRNAIAQLEAAKDLPAAYLRAVFNSPEAQKWERKRIGEFAHTCSGTTPSRDIKEYYVGTIPWIKTGELQDGLIENVKEHISETALCETSLKLLPVNTLLIAMYGQGKTRGRTGLLAKPATINQACFAILPNPDEFESIYLQLWFRFSYSRLRSDSEGRGGNQPNLNGDILRTEQVPLPQLYEQKYIATILNEKIVEAEQLSKTLEEQLEAINKLPASLLCQAFNGEL